MLKTKKAIPLPKSSIKNENKKVKSVNPGKTKQTPKLGVQKKIKKESEKNVKTEKVDNPNRKLIRRKKIVTPVDRSPLNLVHYINMLAKIGLPSKKNLSHESKELYNDIACMVIEKLANESRDLLKYGPLVTIQARHIDCATRIIIPDEEFQEELFETANKHIRMYGEFKKNIEEEERNNK
jgi:hypothetical protein